MGRHLIERGMKPGREMGDTLKAAFEAQLDGEFEDLAGALVKLDPRLRPQTVRAPNNLPANLAPLIGREREQAELHAALAQSHLVTVTGSGGVGKTRIALKCAADNVERYEHGAWFEVEGEELLARALLHEIDHLDGVLFIDRISRLKRELVLRKIRKMQKNGEW